MAKRTTKSTAAADEALNAVEEALKIDFGQEASADEFDDPYAAAPAPQRTVVTPSAMPANDPSGSGAARFTASLSRKPPSSIIWMAVLLSVIWIAVAVWAGYKTIGEPLFSSTAWLNVAEQPSLIYFTGSVLLPLLLIWGFALMIRRSQEMRLAARSMTEVAYRLIEPETESINSVRSVGQAIRVEVNALTDGIERAMARASELEGLVHTEVSSLENSYSDNELRMRALVEELAAERESIVNHTERVRSSISGASETLQEDLSLSAQQISENVATAQLQFAQSLGNTNEEMKASLDVAANNLLIQLNEKGQEIGHQIEGSGGTIVGQIESTREATNKVFEDMQASLAIGSDQLVSGLASRGDELASRIQEAGSGLLTTLTETGTATANSVDEVKAGLSFATENLSSTLAAQGDVISQKIDESGAGLVSKLLETGDATKVAVEDAKTSLNAASESLSTAVKSQSDNLGKQIELSGSGLLAQLSKAGDETKGAIDDANANPCLCIRKTLQQHSPLRAMKLPKA